MQLSGHREAVAYLEQRGLHEPEVIEHMRIGDAPFRCLRAWMNQSGYPFPVLRQAGLVDATGCDAFSHRIVFPLEGNLYGRSILDSVAPHRFLPDGEGVAESMRTAIVNTATSANALHQIVNLVRKPATSGGRAIPEWPAFRQPSTLVNPGLETIGEVYLGRLNPRRSLAFSLRESADPQSRFAFMRSRRVESNCVANPHSGFKHEFREAVGT
jgi:hypothetical protein